MGLFGSSSVENTLGNFLGVGPGGPKGPSTENPGLSQLNQQNTLYDGSVGGMLSGVLQNYMNGGTLQDAMRAGGNNFGEGGPYAGARDVELGNALATNPLTGSRFATDQVQSNPILSQLFGSGGGNTGLLGEEIGRERKLQDQGFQLTPEDHTLYGQASGNIARQFGQQGNQMAQSLASRGLSSSGAAGAGFSGLAGNQNEQLAQAQQQIMQQRFQNTQQQIKQQQSMISQLGGQAQNAIQDQYGRQAQGAQAQKGGLAEGAKLQGQQFQNNMMSENFQVANTPKSYMDFATAGAGQGIQSLMGGGLSGMGAGGPASTPQGGSMPLSKMPRNYEGQVDLDR